jgi:hypothetical protein
MSIDPHRMRAVAALALAAWAAGCASPPAAPPESPRAEVPMRAEHPNGRPAGAPPAAAGAPAPAPAPAPASSGSPIDAVLAYADRVRQLPPAELQQEIQRLGESSYTPVRALQLALALAHSRNGGNAARAQSLLQRVLAQPDGDAPSLHGLARLLSAQVADQRRADEQAERQQQQVRDAQRRIEQLNERLEAVRAIERSVPMQPRRDGPEARPPPVRTTP